jgi:hypothetical protein
MGHFMDCRQPHACMHACQYGPTGWSLSSIDRVRRSAADTAELRWHKCVAVRARCMHEFFMVPLYCFSTSHHCSNLDYSGIGVQTCIMSHGLYVFFALLAVIDAWLFDKYYLCPQKNAVMVYVSVKVFHVWSSF